MAVTLRSLQAKKSAGEKFASLTAYDATLARLVADAGVEVILVGDSLGMVLQGQDSTLPVTVSDMAYHTQCVSRGNNTSATPALVMTDLPFMSYGTVEQGLASAKEVMQAGAHMVKVEGDSWLIPLIQALGAQGVPVCAHLGLTPQSVNKLSGYRVQGREEAHAQTMIEHSVALAEAGADMLLLECVPSELASRITAAVEVPVIGIGAGAATDAQVLVMHDMLGLNANHVPKFVKNFMIDGRTTQEALSAYVNEVKSATFPAEEHGFA
ncbi:MAG: 3-methyl-2-oxobutanoate hydroxymethyltransferase [Oceanobacter sp.]